VVDYDRNRHAAQKRRKVFEIGSFKVHHDAPAESGDLVDDGLVIVERFAAAEAFHEIESNAAHANIVKCLQFGFGDGICHHCNAPVGVATAHQRIGHGGVICAVATRLHDDRALDAEVTVQGEQVISRCIDRLVGAGSQSTVR